jgi:short-subunit dehydrogenase
VLSDVTWFARPILTAYAATKSAAWSFTNALRIEVRDKGIQVLALHVGFVDTDLTRGFDVNKSDPERSPRAHSTRLRKAARKCSPTNKPRR